MRVLSAASVLVTLVFCTAENIVPRWSKPDDVRSQGEWVPLKSDRSSQQPIRIPSAITSPRQDYERAFPQQTQANQFDGDYPKQQQMASQTAPQRVAFVNPQSLGQQQILQSQLQQQLQLQSQLPTQLQAQLPQLDSQQLLAQFLNQQIQQASIPIFNRALLQKQSISNPQYFVQPNQFSIVPTYNQGQLIQNEPFSVSDEREVDEKLISKDTVRQSVPDSNYEKHSKSKYRGEPFNSNLSSTEDSNQKEEIQILYVPIEMLKQQEQNIRGKVGKKTEQNQPLPKDLYSTDVRQQNPEVFQTNQKESRKFRHPIQPLKEQVPAYHLKEPVSQGRATYPSAETISEEMKETKPLLSSQDYPNYKTHPQPRGEYIETYDLRNTNLPTSVPKISGSKEQNVDESTIKGDVSPYRHTEQDRNTRKDYINKPEPSLPPPNQPPLSVFMEKTASSRFGDLISLLRESKTIPVLESIGPDSPQVFVGPSNLHTPSGYIKYELPYLSSLDNFQTGNKLSQVPFFVAPLNFQPPPGFAKIPFPPPHIGSVVLSNITQQALPIEQDPLSQSNPELRTSNYNKETFTIPADISSISPQLPSLINSLQEEEYSRSSSTLSSTESTEPTPIKQKMPSSSRRFNSRGSHRGTVSYGSTTKRPVSRPRRPLHRNSNYRTNQYSDVVTNVPETPIENHDDAVANYYHFKTNKDAQDSTEKLTAERKLVDNPQFSSDDRHLAGIKYTSTIDNVKEEEASKESSNPGFVNQNPAYISKFLNDDTVATSPGQTVNNGFSPPVTINKNAAHSSSPQYHNTGASSSPQYHNTGASREVYDEYHTTDFNDKVTRNGLGSTEKQFSTVGTTRKYEEPHLYQQASPLPYTEDSSITSDYEEVNYRKRIRDYTSKSPPITDQNYNFRQKEQMIETPHHLLDSDYSRETMNQESVNLQTHAREQEQQRQPVEDTKALHSPYRSYVPNNEEQNTKPFLQKSNYESLSQESLEPYRDVQRPDKLPENIQKQYNYHESPQTTNRYEENNEKTNYDVNVPEPPTPTTEKTFPTRTRSRSRGRTYHQRKTSTEPAVSLSSNEESDESGHYSKPDVTTSPPGRRYSHTRNHRRPLRPTVSTTTTTTTNAPPGTKYLIRTRRPTVPQTRLHTGRGRIRKPTTPTTTVPTTTTEQLNTLPILWQQPHRLSPSQNDYRSKDGGKQIQHPGLESSEYVEETPQYSDEGNNDKSTYGLQNDRSQDLRQVNLKKFSETDAPRRVPSYSFETQEENFQTQKQFRTSPQPYYADDYETTPKIHYSRNYEATQKQQYFRDYETTQKPQYSKAQEATQKAHYPRDFDTTQKAYYPRDYETTQKPQRLRDYEITQKTPYFREYETTEKQQYSSEYETTPKQQYFREYETTQKPQYYRELETTQNPPQIRNHDAQPSPKFHNDYETTKKIVYSGDYETTEKSKNYKDYYDTTKKAVSYQEYETTPKPYVTDDEASQKQSYGHSTRQPHRTSNHRRRPSTRYDSSKQVKTNQGEVPVKEPDSDYWNQAVTIQQSQSYVFNPDETYSDERQASSPTKPKYESSQNDYDDYYNTQESEQYSSDQSPFPSNEQRITYTQIKANQYTGKASQYPRKNDATQFQKDTPDKEIEKGDQQTDDLPESTFDKTEDSSEDKVKTLIPTQIYESNPSVSTESLEVQNNSKITQGNKRRGTWVRRRITKPADLFETAESQRISSMRENSLLTEINPKEQQIKAYTKEKNNVKVENHHQINTSEVGSNEKEVMKNDSLISETYEEKIAETEENSSTDKADTETAKETTTGTTERDEVFSTYQTPSITSLDTDQLKDTSEPYRTSTTTEISLETEICYKGQCIKTKRRKENDETVFIPTVES